MNAGTGITYSFWIKPGPYSHTYLVSKYMGAGEGIAMMSQSNGQMCAFGGNSQCNNNGPSTCIDNGWTEGVWTMITVVYSAGYGYQSGMHIYKNGNHAATGSFKHCEVNAPLTVGEWDRGRHGSNNNGNKWKGFFDEFMIFRKALSSGEVKELYNSAEHLHQCLI